MFTQTQVKKTQVHRKKCSRKRQKTCQKHTSSHKHMSTQTHVHTLGDVLTVGCCVFGLEDVDMLCSL